VSARVSIQWKITRSSIEDRLHLKSQLRRQHSIRGPKTLRALTNTLINQCCLRWVFLSRIMT